MLIFWISLFRDSRLASFFCVSFASVRFVLRPFEGRPNQGPSAFQISPNTPPKTLGKPITPHKGFQRANAGILSGPRGLQGPRGTRGSQDPSKPNNTIRLLGE